MTAKIFQGVPKNEKAKDHVERFKAQLLSLDRKLAEVDVRSEKLRR